jgi:putative peptide zinc metalloprotease protein
MPVLQTLATLGEEARLLPSTRDSSPNGDAPTGPTPWGGTPDPQGTDPWPFPFDRPAPPGPDDNRAEAYNTANGSTLTDVATFLLLSLAGEPVDQANETDAWASCRSCRTVAVAFEVILIIGYVDEVAPTNTATALNYDCVDCSTSAFAYQLVLTLAEMPDGTALAQLAQILQGVGDLDLASLSDEDIYLALEEARREILDLLGGSVVTGVAGSLLTSHSGSSSTDVPSDTADPTDAGTTTTAPSDTTTTSAPTNTTTTSEPTTTTTTSDPTTATTSEPTTTTTSDPTTTTTTTTTEPTTTTTTTTTDNTSTSP